MTELPQGQLSSSEREYLFDVVVNLKPNIVLESGTWYGGGSTLYLAKALLQNKIGILYTYEEHTPFYSVAENYYKSSEYSAIVKLHNLDFVKGIHSITEEEFQSVGVVFLDGGDEAPNGCGKRELSEYYVNPDLSENVQSFKILQATVKTGTHILLHDWSVYGGRGNFVRQYLINNPDIAQKFQLIQVIGGSTGLAHLVKIA